MVARLARQLFTTAKQVPLACAGTRSSPTRAAAGIDAADPKKRERTVEDALITRSTRAFSTIFQIARTGSAIARPSCRGQVA
jgi:hypothetical protein